MMLALGLEGVQYWLPHRAWNVNDVMGNLMGVGIGCLVLGFSGWRRDKDVVKTKCLKGL